MFCLRARFLFLLIPLLLVGAVPARAQSPGDFTVRSLAVINLDERGAPLSYPRSIFYDRKAREMYVVVSGRREVVILSSDYYPVISAGHGRGLRGVNGGFADSEDIFFCLAGKSKEAGALLVYDRALLPVGKIELRGFPGADQFKPRQVVFRDGFFYCVGLGSMGLLKFDADGLFRKRIIPRDQVLGVEEEAFVRSFRIDSQGRFFLLSEGMGRIFVYSPEGELLYAFGTKGGSSGKLSRPRALALNEKLGLVFVVDYMRHAVNVYSMAGEYLFEFGGKGVGRGWFAFPSDITIDERGRLWVADTFNHRVQVFELVRREPERAGEEVPEVGPLVESPAIAGSLQTPEITTPDDEDQSPGRPPLPETPLSSDEVQESDL